MAFHPIVDANHAWRLSTTIWSLQSSAGFVRKKNEQKKQKKTDHIFNEIVVSVSFCSIFILPLQTWSSSEILISFSVYLLVCMPFCSMCL